MNSITDLINAPHQAVDSWATSLPSLDSLVGGFRRGQLWLITGVPRSGKSLLATQFVHTLGVTHDFAVSYVSSRRMSPAVTRSRLVGLSLGRVATESPDHRLPDKWALTKDREALAWLCAAPIEVISGGGLGLPSESESGHETREAIVIDYEEPVPLGSESLAEFRRVADSGRIVILTAPRSHCIKPNHHPILGDRGERFAEELASVGDVIVEVVPDAESGYPEYLWIALNRAGSPGWIPLRESRAWLRFQEVPHA